MVFIIESEPVKEAEIEFRDFLKRKRLRLTGERMAILNEVIAANGHFEADDIYVRLRKKKNRASQTSVYRTLPLLVEAGIVRKTLDDHMQARYEPIFGTAHHDHMVCVQCGSVIEFQNDTIEKLQEKMAKKHKFKMLGHRLLLSGICSKCK